MQIPRILMLAALAWLGTSSIPCVMTMLPAPQSVITSSDKNTKLIDPKFKFVLAEESPVASMAAQRYERYLTELDWLARCSAPSDPTKAIILSHCDVNIANPNATQDLYVSEKYSITIFGGCIINADTPVGALRALETFSQLIRVDEATGDIMMPFGELLINDFPTYPYRGLLVDSSRHFQPLWKLAEVVDVMAAAKMNVLHWHITDAQSWPLILPDFPEVSQKGSWDPEATYTRDALQHFIEYATSRGVVIIPEIDLPAHIQSVYPSHPEFIVDCAAARGNQPLDPSNAGVLPFLDHVLEYVSSLFPSTVVHIGGDEVKADCWLQDANVTQWMAQHNMTTSTQVYAYFVNHAVNKLQQLGKTPMGWQTVLVADTPTDVIIEPYMDIQSFCTALKGNYKAVLSAGFYLDQQVPSLNGKTHYLWLDTWTDFFGNSPDPVAKCSISDPTQIANAIGIELCQWGEQVDSASIIPRIFPRAFGGAERGWCAKDVTDVGKATERMNAFACLVSGRDGIPVGPVSPSYCRFTAQ